MSKNTTPAPDTGNAAVSSAPEYTNEIRDLVVMTLNDAVPGALAASCVGLFTAVVEDDLRVRWWSENPERVLTSTELVGEVAARGGRIGLIRNGRLQEMLPDDMASQPIEHRDWCDRADVQCVLDVDGRTGKTYVDHVGVAHTVKIGWDGYAQIDRTGTFKPKPTYARPFKWNDGLEPGIELAIDSAGSSIPDRAWLTTAEATALAHAILQAVADVDRERAGTLARRPNG